MSYEPQPGTIQHRAIAWLRSAAKVRPGYAPSTVEFCTALGVDTENFSAYMRPAREHGIVHTSKASGCKVLFWRLGDGTPDPQITGRPANDALPRKLAPRDLRAIPTSAFPPAPPIPVFRAVEWDGHLLVTGMEIRDGVAIFRPEQVEQLRERTAWWRAGA